MEPNQLQALYGHRCRAVVRCHGCGRAHAVEGTLAPARSAGDVLVNGHTYAVSDLISVVSNDPIIAARPGLGIFLPYLWAGWLLLVTLQLLAHH